MDGKTNGFPIYELFKDIKIQAHDYFDVSIIHKTGEKEQYFAYNEVLNYNGVIDSMRIYNSANGRGMTKYIEPEDDEDTTTYWKRKDNPTYKLTSFTCQVNFTPSSNGEIDTVELYGGGIVNRAKLQDVNGCPIIFTYTSEDTITIHAYIYFTVPALDEEENHDTFNGRTSLKMFNGSNSILCGSDPNLKLLTYEIKRNDEYIIEGYLPNLIVKGIGITQNPMPPTIIGKGINYLAGGINNYQIIPSSNSEGTLKILKNATVDGVQRIMKGLITGIIIPGIGVYDLDNENRKIQDNKDKILPGSVVLKDYAHYIPRKYIASGAIENALSMDKSAFRNVNYISVHRYNESKDIEVLDNNTFFSDADYKDTRVTNCKGYSQHIPMTENQYIGAETIIPCSPGEDLSIYYRDKNDTEGKNIHHLPLYGYYIDYYGINWEDIDWENETNELLNFEDLTENRIEKINKKYGITANYIVVGEYYCENEAGTVNGWATYDCKLEYYDLATQSFKLAIDTSQSAVTGENGHAYCKLDFKDENDEDTTITSILWRLSSSISATASCIRRSTVGNPIIKDATEGHPNGYDPYFIYIGCSSDETDKNGIKIYNDWPPEAQENITTTIPYLYRKKDRLFLSTYYKEVTR